MFRCGFAGGYVVGTVSMLAAPSDPRHGARAIYTYIHIYTMYVAS